MKFYDDLMVKALDQAQKAYELGEVPVGALIIDEKGFIYHLVDDEKRAWHAGTSFWQGCTDLNNRSLGIELANPGHSYGYQPENSQNDK